MSGVAIGLLVLGIAVWVLLVCLIVAVFAGGRIAELRERAFQHPIDGPGDDAYRGEYQEHDDHEL